MATRPTLGESGIFHDTPPALANALPSVMTGEHPSVTIPSTFQPMATTPSGLGNRGHGAGLEDDTGHMPVLAVAPRISPVNSTHHLPPAQEMVPGADNGQISPHVNLHPPVFHSTTPGSPDGTPDGLGMTPAGPEVNITSGGGGGSGTDRAQPSYGAKAIGGPTPAFPELASKEGLSGTVIVLVTLNSHAAVVKAIPSPRSECDVLDNAAVRAARSWTYQAAVKNGVSIGGTVRLKFVFANEQVVVTPL